MKILALALVLTISMNPASAQVLFTPNQLDQFVSPIALHPDPLLAQVLSASTCPKQLRDATDWADQHANLTGNNLANAITVDNLTWDPSVLAMLPFPSVLDRMAGDDRQTLQLGDAVLRQRAAPAPSRSRR